MSKIKEMKEEEYFLWQSIIPELKKNIDYCIKQIRQNSIQTFPPEDFEEKKNKIRFILGESNNIDEEEFLDVFTFMIEERVNLSLLQLADQFTSNFGKDPAFWTGKITQWTNMMTFTNSMVIWTVTDFNRNFVNYGTNPLRRDVIYQWRPKVQAYLSSLQFLIRKIQKIKMKDNAFALDDAYVKYHKEKVLYTTFVNKLGMKSEDEKSSQYQQVTITLRNKSKAEKKLFNFPRATKTLDEMDSFGGKNSRVNVKKSVNTLEKYNFLKKGNSRMTAQEFQMTSDEEQRLTERKRIIETLERIGKNDLQRADIEILRDELRQKQLIQKQQQKRQYENIQNSNLTKSSRKLPSMDPETQTFQVLQCQSFQSSEMREYPMNHATFICNPQDYFSFEGYPIGSRGISVSNPFIMYPWINYFINDMEEYEQIMSFSLGESLGDESDSETNSEDNESLAEQGIVDDSDFIDYRLVVTSDNVDFDKLPLEDRINFAQLISEQRVKWVADYKCPQAEQALSTFSCIPVYGSQLPYLIQGTDDPRTKRKGLFTKDKNLKSNQVQQYQIQVIAQTVEEDNSTTNFGAKRQNLCVISENIVKNFKEKQEQIEIFDEETTFEEKMQFSSISNQNYENYKHQQHSVNQLEQQKTRRLSSIDMSNEFLQVQASQINPVINEKSQTKSCLGKSQSSKSNTSQGKERKQYNLRSKKSSTKQNEQNDVEI